MENLKRKRCSRRLLRERVLEEASRAFREQGIRPVRMDDLAATLSISKRTLYELFHDKEHLLLAIFERHQQEMYEYFSKITSGAGNALEVIFAFYERKLGEISQLNPAFLRDLRKYPEALHFLRVNTKANDAEALKYFKRGVEEGIFRSDINFDIINQAMSMQLEMMIFSDMTETFPLAEIYTEMTFLHIRGITTRKGEDLVDEFSRQIKEKQEKTS